MIDLVKYLLLLAFLIPSFSFGALAPSQVRLGQYASSSLSSLGNTPNYATSTWNAFPFSASNPLFEFRGTIPLNTFYFPTPFDFTFDPNGDFIYGGEMEENASYTSNYPQIRMDSYYSTSSSPFLTQTALGSNGGFTGQWHYCGNDMVHAPYTYDPTPDVRTRYFQSLPLKLKAVFTTGGSSCLNTASHDNFIYVNFLYQASTSTVIDSIIGYSKLRWDSNVGAWRDTLSGGASGSWDFTSTSTLPVDFSDFAQGLKDAIVNNTTQPECPALSSILDIGNQAFWQDCVLPTIFNWLFVPSSDAIDYMVNQMTESTQYGSSFVYILLAPVVSSVAVTACDLDNVSACFVGSPLTLPVLDVTGSSTPTVIDVNIPYDTSGFDDFMATVVATLVLLGVGHVTLFKFL